MVRLRFSFQVSHSQFEPQTPADVSSVHLLPSASTSTQAAREITQAGVVAISFSPLSSTLFTFERPVKSETDVHKNVKAWSVESGEEVGGWHQKSLNDWYVIVAPARKGTNHTGSQSSLQTRATYSDQLAQTSWSSHPRSPLVRLCV